MESFHKFSDFPGIETDSDSLPRKLDIRALPVAEACDQITEACRELTPGESIHVIGPVPPVYVKETLDNWEGLTLHMLTTDSERRHLLISMEE